MSVGEPHGEDESLLRRVLAGERAAARQFAERWIPTVHAVVGRQLVRRRRFARLQEDIDDLVQATFEALFAHDARKLRQYRPDGGRSLGSWIGLVARQTAHTLARGKQAADACAEPLDAEEPGAALADVVTPEDLTAVATLATRLRRALDGEEERALFDGLVDGLGAEELAIVLEIGTDAVHSRIARLRRKLRKFLPSTTETSKSARKAETETP
jgi:RNA polymerase sigma factor (sigma-70 family)